MYLTDTNCTTLVSDSDFMQMGRIDSLIRSLSDVDVKISTYRDLHQDEALYQVNSLIDLICQVQEDEVEKEAICKRYIRLCDAYVGSSGIQHCCNKNLLYFYTF